MLAFRSPKKLQAPFSDAQFESPKRAGISCAWRCRAFSLVEVIFALGVMSFAMSGLIGLLSVGMGLSRDFMNRTAESEVVQAVSNELQLMDYSAVVGDSATYGNTFPRFYDDGGAYINASDTGVAPFNACFKVILRQQFCRLPGAAVEDNVATCVVFEVVRLRSGGEKGTYSALAVNNGR